MCLGPWVSSKFGVRELPAAGPVVLPSHGVVQEPIVGNGRLLGVNNGNAVSGRRHDPLRVDEHLQVGGFDHRPHSSTISASQLHSMQFLTDWYAGHFSA